HAAELNGQGDPDTVARIKADYRTTLGALHLEYLRTWVDWAHAHGSTARNQAHGSPGNLLDLYAAADIPETEIFGSIPFPIPGFRRDPAEIGRPGHPPIIHRFASSAAHVMGKPYASSETFTWLREHFHESPSEMKPELDALFLAGINHVFYHGDAYSPEDAPWPGWLFYASSQLNTRNPLWRDLGDSLNTYIARAQSLLQAGQPDNDLLVYWPADDLWHNAEGQMIQLTVHASWLEASRTGQLMHELTAKGFSYDLISDTQLAQAHCEKGQLKTPGGLYRTMLVPETDHMEAGTLRRLLDLANDGATVNFAGSLPKDVPGYGQLSARREALKAQLARIGLKHGPDGISWAPLGKGKVWVGPAEKIPAGSREPMADAGLQFIRRKLADGTLYFIVNQGGKSFEGWMPLYCEAESAVQMNPRRGGAGVAAIRQNHGVPEVYLQQAPGESYFIRTFTSRAANGPAMRYLHPAGEPVELGGDWKVTATRGGPELPPAFTQHGLGS
ncbi:MAG: glycosyl hydrolase, partial [bacterium]|nr:glycosyl hydrolase [bacterium]